MKKFTGLQLYTREGKKVKRDANINGFFSFQLQTKSGIVMLSGMGGYKILELNVSVVTCCPRMLVAKSALCSICNSWFEHHRPTVEVISCKFATAGMATEWHDLSILESFLQEAFSPSGVMESIVETQDVLRFVEYFGHHARGYKYFWQRLPSYETILSLRSTQKMLS